MITNMKRPLLLFAIVFGLAISIMGSGFQTSLSDFDKPWLAKVNDHYIAQDEFLLNQKKLAGKLNDPQLLSLMMDNTLLIQRAQELGLIDSDRVVKKAIVHSLVEKVVHQAIAIDPSQTTLKTFYQKNAKLFSQPDKFKVQIAQHPLIKGACSQKGFMDSNGNISETWLAHVVQHPASRGFLSQVLLHRHFGPSIAKHISSLQDGDISQSFNSQGSCLSFYVKEKQTSQLANFEQIKGKVLGEYRSQKRRGALNNLLNSLKQNSNIILANEVKHHIGQEEYK